VVVLAVVLGLSGGGAAEVTASDLMPVHLCVAGMVRNRAKASADVLSVGLMVAPLGVGLPDGGIMARHHALRRAGLSG
jgi:hypothetical protein